MGIQSAIYDALTIFGCNILVEKRFVNILDDYGVFRNNRVLRVVVRDLVEYDFFVRLFAKTNYELDSFEYRSSVEHDVLDQFPFREDVVHLVMDAIIDAVIN